MNWRQFKQQPEGFKGLKGFKPPEDTPLKPLKPLKPAEGDLKIAAPDTARPHLRRRVDEALAEVDRMGRPWPLRFLADLPAEDRQRLRELEAAVDQAALSGDEAVTDTLLTEWRTLLLRHLN